jgi:hypothetical protein
VIDMALGQILAQSLSRNEYYSMPAKRSPASLSGNLNRLLSAAVVSPRFRRLLLSDPAAALAAGYNGEQFHLTPEEYAAVTSLRVYTIRDFAAQLLATLQYAATDASPAATATHTNFHYPEVVAHSLDTKRTHSAMS